MSHSRFVFRSLLPLASIVAIAMGGLGCVGPDTPAAAATPQSPPPSAAGVELAQPPAPTPPPSSTAPVVASAPVSPPPSPPSHAEARAHVYRFDFVLTGSDVNASFSLNLEEHLTGEVSMGKNVPLLSTTTPSPATAAPRQDMGMKVRAHFASTSAADEVILHVDFELSGADSGQVTTFRKITSTNDVLTPTGKSTLVSSMDEDKKHLQLTVTATRIR